MQLLDKSHFNHIFESLRGSKVALLPWAGNWGDELIYVSTLLLLKEFEINFKEEKNNFDEFDILLFPGGGNLGNFYPNTTRFATAAASTGKVCIALPQTLSSATNLEMFHKIYLREHLSLSYFPAGILAPDLALYYPYPDTKPQKLTTGVFLRKDSEANWRFQSGNGDAVKIATSMEDYIRLAGEFEHIVTDRLHFAIAALGQGRRVTLLPNVYHKNRGVWQDYLQQFGCEWASQPLQ